MTIKNGDAPSWADIKVKLNGVESPGLVSVKAIQATAAQVVEDNTRGLIAEPKALTEAETLDIQERAQLLMGMRGVVSNPYGRAYGLPAYTPAVEDTEPFTSSEAPTRPDHGAQLTELPYGRGTLADHDGYPARTLRAWRKPEQRRPRSTSMVGTGPVFVGELDHPCDFHALATEKWLSDRGWCWTPEGPKPMLPVASASQGSGPGPVGGNEPPPGEGPPDSHYSHYAPQGGVEQWGPCSVWRRFRAPYRVGLACSGKPPGWESSRCRESLSLGALGVVTGTYRGRA